MLILCSYRKRNWFISFVVCIDASISAQAVEAGYVSYWFGPEFPWLLLSANGSDWQRELGASKGPSPTVFVRASLFLPSMNYALGYITVIRTGAKSYCVTCSMHALLWVLNLYIMARAEIRTVIQREFDRTGTCNWAIRALCVLRMLGLFFLLEGLFIRK